MNKDNCLDYLDRACLFRAKFLIRSCLGLVLEDPQTISKDDLAGLVKKHPELGVEIFEYNMTK